MERAEDKTILVVDDEPNVRDYLKLVLEDAGFNVVTAGDGVEALEVIRQKTPDFISLDLVMPKKSGHHLLRELKKDRQLARIPVLIVTAHAHDEFGKGDLKDLVDKRIVAGPDNYLEKPVNPKDYVRCIQRTLGIEETRDTAATSLRDELNKSMEGASPEALKKALDALKKSGQF